MLQCGLGGGKFDCRLDTGNDVIASISNSIGNYLGDKGIYLPFRPMTADLTGIDGTPLTVIGECQISCCYKLRQDQFASGTFALRTSRTSNYV